MIYVWHVRMYLLECYTCPIGCGSRIHRLLLYWGVGPPPSKCPRYDIKQSDGEVLVMLKFWGMWSNPSLPSLPGPLWLGVVALDRVLSMGRIKINYVLMLNCIVWNGTIFDIETVYLCSTELFKIELFICINQQWLLCHKTKPNQAQPNQNVKEGEKLYDEVSRF